MPGRPDFKALIRSLWPIIFIVLLGLVFRIDLVISVIFVLVVVIISQRISRRIVFDGLKKGFAIEIIALIFGVMTLMYAIERTGVATQFYSELLSFGIPPFMVVFTVPFVVGLLTGVTSAYIGVGFPVVLPLIGTAAVSHNSGMLLAFAGGFMGIMASPVHLCLVLTYKYFKASLARTLALLIVPIIVTSLVSWILAITIYR
jgi:hypothetical protein